MERNVSVVPRPSAKCASCGCPLSSTMARALLVVPKSIPRARIALDHIRRLGAYLAAHAIEVCHVPNFSADGRPAPWPVDQRRRAILRAQQGAAPALRLQGADERAFRGLLLPGRGSGRSPRDAHGRALVFAAV